MLPFLVSNVYTGLVLYLVHAKGGIRKKNVGDGNR